jgi:predicted RNase H-like nuclease (RuvC/YqgF family)
VLHEAHQTASSEALHEAVIEAVKTAITQDFVKNTASSDVLHEAHQKHIKKTDEVPSTPTPKSEEYIPPVLQRDFEKRIAELEAENTRLKMEKAEDKEEIKELKADRAKLTDKVIEQSDKILEITERVLPITEKALKLTDNAQTLHAMQNHSTSQIIESMDEPNNVNERKGLLSSIKQAIFKR